MEQMQGQQERLVPPRSRRDPRGESRFGVLPWLLVGLLVIYAGSKFIPPYWAYLAMQDPVKEAALAAGKAGGEERARQAILSAAKDQEIELTDDGIEITVDNQVLTVRVTWETPVELPKYRKVLHFTIEKSAPAP